jgi:FtsH-binding integral membrane protein
MYTKSSIMRGGSSGKMEWKLGSLLREKSSFLASVFATLIVQLALVFFVIKSIENNDSILMATLQFMYLLFILQLIIVLVLVLVPMHAVWKFVLFSIFSLLTALTLNVVVNFTSAEIVQIAIVSTIVIFLLFAGLGAVLSGFGINLGGFGLILFFALLGLIVANLISLFMREYTLLHRALAFIGILVFAAYIVYDTNQILQRDYHGDFVTAAFDYYLDVINVFLNITKILNNK